jgi:hypothetical protein
MPGWRYDKRNWLNIVVSLHLDSHAHHFADYR